MSTYVLYNGLSGNGTGKTKAEAINSFIGNKEPIYMDITSISDIRSFLTSLENDDSIYLCGGDGTLNHFINDTDGTDIAQPLYYFPTGSGNDFWNDLGKKIGDAPVKINEYLKDLPFVEVNGMKKRFLNGIGYGIDGYCCEVGDQMREAERPLLRRRHDCHPRPGQTWQGAPSLTAPLPRKRQDQDSRDLPFNF